jgi:hypothetical protein
MQNFRAGVKRNTFSVLVGISEEKKITWNTQP